MAFTTPTVSDFKAQFARDFPYSVPAYGAAGLAVVAAGVITAINLAAGGFGYTDAPAVAISDAAGPGAGATANATIANGAVTGFVVTAGGTGYVQPVIAITGGAGSEGDLTNVRDADITGAMQDALFNVNASIFATQADWARAFLYYAAHCLVRNFLASAQGLRSQFNWLAASKAAGALSQSFVIPDQIKDSPFLSLLSTTGYGERYLEIVSPFLVGNMTTGFRKTPP